MPVLVNNVSSCSLDVDECRGKVSKCEKTQTCINAPGSYKCSCPKTGYNHASKCKGTGNLYIYKIITSLIIRLT